MEYNSNLKNYHRYIWQWQVAGWSLFSLIWMVALPMAIYLYTNTDPIISVTETLLIVVMLSLNTWFCFARARDLQCMQRTELVLCGLRQSLQAGKLSSQVDSLVRRSLATRGISTDKAEAPVPNIDIDHSNVIKFPKTFNHVE